MERKVLMDFLPFVKNIIRHYRGDAAAAQFLHHLALVVAGMVGYMKQDMPHQIAKPLAFGVLVIDGLVQIHSIENAQAFIQVAPV